MDTQNTSRQLCSLEEVRIPLHRAGFEPLPLEGEQLPVLWNDAPLCRITGKGSVFYRREDADTPQAEDALYRVEDIAAKTLEYMTAMEAAPQLKAGGLDGVTGSTGTAGSGEATSPDGCRPKTVAGVGCADVAGLTGAADGAETGMVTGVAAGAVRAAGGISTSRGVGIAVVCAAAALATATAASTAA